MIPFRYQVMTWYGIGLCLTMILTITALMLCIIIQIYHEEHEELETLAVNISNHLQRMPIRKREHSNKAKSIFSLKRNEQNEQNTDTQYTVKNLMDEDINEKIFFLFDEDNFNIAYAVLDKQDTLLYEFTGYSGKSLVSSFPLSLGLSHQILSYKNWVFYYYIEGINYNIAVSSTHKFETIDQIIASSAILIPLIVIISFFISSYITKKVSLPLINIAEAAKKIENGDLSARIPELHSRNEIGELTDNLNQTFSRLQSMIDRIKQFSSDAAHELKTPLTAISGNIEVCLRKSRTPQEYIDTMETTLKETRLLIKIVEMLLLLEKPISEFQDNQFEVHDFSLILRNAIDYLKPIAEKSKIELNRDIAGNIMVAGVDIFLHEMCSNIINNAIKFSSSGSHIDICLHKKSHDIILEVRDFGIGIDKQHQKKVFDRFYQVEQSHSHGTGLGLSVVSYLVKLHRGQIYVDSEIGKGTYFKIKLPSING